MPTLAENDSDISNSMSRIAIAHNMRGDARKALAVANACKERVYPQVGCHLEAGIALEKLHRMEEAKVAYTATSVLTKKAIETLQRRLGESLRPDERALVESLIAVNEAIGGRADAKLNP